jgi:hypothetical protein
MKKQVQSLWFVSAAAVVLSVGSLSAQSTAPTQTPDAQSQSTQTPAPEAQPTQEGRPSQTPEAQQSQSQQNQAPDTQSQPAPSQAQPSQSPDASGQGTSGSSSGSSAQSAGAQSFSGTVVKSGDKYVLKDEASGNTYDIDHQDEVQKFDGKRVKVHGTLDASGKMIHLQ